MTPLLVVSLLHLVFSVSGLLVPTTQQHTTDELFAIIQQLNASVSTCQGDFLFIYKIINVLLQYQYIFMPLGWNWETTFLLLSICLIMSVGLSMANIEPSGIVI